MVAMLVSVSLEIRSRFLDLKTSEVHHICLYCNLGSFWRTFIEQTNFYVFIKTSNGGL